MGGLISLRDIDIDQYRGQMIAVTGPMRSGKTEHAIEFADVLGHTRAHVRFFATDVNDRDVTPEDAARGVGRIVSASRCGGEPRAIPAFVYNGKNPLEILTKLEEEDRRTGGIDVVVLEEVNFSSDMMIPVIDELTHYNGSGRVVVCLGLDYTFRGEAYGVMGWVLGNTRNVISRTARCKIVDGGHVCGRPATRTLRLLNLENECGYTGELVSVEDKYGNVLNNYTLDPFFAPTHCVDEKDDGETEKGKRRLYTVACSKHFGVPFALETKRLHQSLIGEGWGNLHERQVELARVIEEHGNTPWFDYMLHFITGERGVHLVDGTLRFQPQFKGMRAGHYLNVASGGVHGEGNKKVYMYKPELILR